MMDKILNDKLTKIEKNQKIVITTVTKLELAVCGNKQIGVKGIVKQVNEHEKYIEADKKRKWMFAGGITVIASAVGIFWNKIIN